MRRTVQRERKLATTEALLSHKLADIHHIRADQARRRGIHDVERMAQVPTAPAEAVAQYASLINGQLRALTGSTGWKSVFQKAQATARDQGLGLDMWCARRHPRRHPSPPAREPSPLSFLCTRGSTTNANPLEHTSPRIGPHLHGLPVTPYAQSTSPPPKEPLALYGAPRL